MEKIPYTLTSSGKPKSYKCAYAVIALLTIILFTSLASLTLVVKIFMQGQKLNEFYEKVATDVKDFVEIEHKFETGMEPAICPNIVSREDWKARPPKGREDMKTPVPFVILHHTAMDECFNFDDCCAEMRKIQIFHQDVRGWDDIGYSYLVGEDGLVYEGRNWTTVGTHAPWYNFRSIGISIMGNYTDKLPNQAAIVAVQRLIECALLNGVLDPDYILYGHRQARNGTECPGDALFQYIQTWPHWKPGDHFPPKS